MFIDYFKFLEKIIALHKICILLKFSCINSSSRSTALSQRFLWCLFLSLSFTHLSYFCLPLKMRHNLFTVSRCTVITRQHMSVHAHYCSVIWHVGSCTDDPTVWCNSTHVLAGHTFTHEYKTQFLYTARVYSFLWWVGKKTDFF